MLGYKVPLQVIEDYENKLKGLEGIAQPKNEGFKAFCEGVRDAFVEVKMCGLVNLDTNWHTGTPKKDGEYLVWTTGDLPLIVTKNAHGIWEDDYYGYQKVREEDIVAWQKITPYEGEKEDDRT